MACEAYMKTDYYKLADDDFQQTLNDYLSYLVKEEKFLKHNIILIYYKKKPINQASFFLYQTIKIFPVRGISLIFWFSVYLDIYVVVITKISYNAAD